MASSPRLGLRRPEGADNFSIAGDLSNHADVLDNAAIDQSGTLAARPAANSVAHGTYYFATDTDVVYRSDGSNWKVVGVRSAGSIAGSELADNAVTAAKIGKLIYCHAYKTASTSLPDGATTALPLTDEVVDTDGLHDPSTNSSRITVQRAGLYSVDFACVFSAVHAALGLALYVNGSPAGAPYVAPIGTPSVNASGSTKRVLAVNDYVELRATNESGSSKTAIHTHLQLLFMGPLT